MRVISVVSLKGGVGKTSVVLGLAGAAWERGLPTLVIDLDPQANATTALDPAPVRLTASDVLADARDGGLAAAVVPAGWGGAVSVVAAEPALEHRNRPDRSTSSGHGALRLRRAMHGLDAYALVLIDSPPALSALTRNALAASDLALVVTEPTLFALQGAQQALAAIDAVRHEHHVDVRPAGIVVNRARGHAEHRYRLDELHAAYGHLVLDPPLPDRAAVQQAAGAYVPVQSWRSAGARQVSAVFSAHLDQLLALAAAGFTESGRS